jgi:hypothetical protein
MVALPLMAGIRLLIRQLNKLTGSDFFGCYYNMTIKRVPMGFKKSLLMATNEKMLIQQKRSQGNGIESL